MAALCAHRDVVTMSVVTTPFLLMTLDTSVCNPMVINAAAVTPPVNPPLSLVAMPALPPHAL